MVMRLVCDLDESVDLTPQSWVDEPAAMSERMTQNSDVDGTIEEAPPGEAHEPTADLRVLEALLLSTHHPLTPARLAELVGVESVKPVRKAVVQLNKQYEETGRAFRIEQVAGGYQLLTLPELGDHVRKLQQREADAKLTKAAIETLAIIAYKQPILRADVEAIRGVACGETIRSLMEKHLVKIAGRAEEPGRPILYGTTKRFLEVFGLNSLKDLPVPEALKPPETIVADAPTDPVTAPAEREPLPDGPASAAEPTTP